ncbi:hypothetical protein DY218_30575 [Streptomyces triticagri]|uniref:Uncharacterized protein n=1 Tax=Streptomyces triticagri TaxID=2293568 RepID=A0A372LW47_9ACTN|nr:hypothetical protein [Streptomyces triticagri]RFU82884.1 hypothetical protein DY218_30575 [Streptomyces triticagri]
MGPTSKAYPVTPEGGDDDPRFTFGLLHDVRMAIQSHDYPEISNGLDLVDLQMALFGFLYGTNERRAGE